MPKGGAATSEPALRSPASKPIVTSFLVNVDGCLRAAVLGEPPERGDQSGGNAIRANVALGVMPFSVNSSTYQCQSQLRKGSIDEQARCFKNTLEPGRIPEPRFPAGVLPEQDVRDSVLRE